jgi:hypothetical protein
VSGGYGQGTGAGFNSLQPAVSPAPPPPPPSSLGRNEPYFDTLTPRNVTALVGNFAYLSCRVRNLGNKTVSEVLTAVVLKMEVTYSSEMTVDSQPATLCYIPEDRSFWKVNGFSTDLDMCLYAHLHSSRQKLSWE